MLYDNIFLEKLIQHKEKTTYARVIALDINENPLETIEGRVTQGSINVDGSSVIRRSCSLTLLAKRNVDFNDYYWGLKTKFKLEIGLQNKVSTPNFYSNYPDIIWFNMGTYIITSFNMQLSTNNFTMSLQGKDKMCLLNGDVAGTINATTDFATYDYYDSKTKTTINQKLRIKDIIYDGVHTYANEPFHNIIINDLDEMGLSLLEYRGDSPLYLIKDIGNDKYIKIEKNGNTVVYTLDNDNNYIPIKISELDTYLNNSDLISEGNAQTIYLTDESGSVACAVAKVSFGETIGYQETDLVYAGGKLVANPGEAFTSVLEKIKKMLGEFEYFYNLNGQFVFQRKKSLINTPWTPKITNALDETYVEDLVQASNIIYNFNDKSLFSSIQNTPNLANLKNDFTVWGERKGIGGAKIPIHMRYAIDKKPTVYLTYDDNILYTIYNNETELLANEYGEILWNKIQSNPPDGSNNNTIKYKADWRELIYQMALDYRKHNHDDYFEVNLAKKNPQFPTGKTGYEQYYTDLEGFWRQLYEYIDPNNTNSNTSSLNKQDSLSLTTYNNIRYKVNDPDLYIKGLFKPIAQKVISIPSSLIVGFERNYKHMSDGTYRLYNDDTSCYIKVGEELDKYFLMNENARYARSITQGLSFVNNPALFNSSNINDYRNWAFQNELYKITIPTSMAQLYVFNQTYKTFHPAIDIFDLTQIFTYQNYNYQFCYSYVDPKDKWSKTQYVPITKDLNSYTTNEKYKLYVARWQDGKTKKYFSIDRILSELLDYLLSQYSNLTFYIYDANQYYSILQLKNYGIGYLKNSLFKDMSELNESYRIGLANNKGNVLKNHNNVYRYDYIKPQFYIQIRDFYLSTENEELMGWNKIISQSAYQLNFWFDFLDCDGDVDKYSVQKIGSRPKVVKESTIKSIYYKDTPKIIFYSGIEQPVQGNKEKGYSYYQLPELYEWFKVSSQGVAAKNKIDDLLYTHSYCAESIQITSVPIYFLNVNNRIKIKDEETNLNGEYVVSKLSFSLAYNGTMSITATKAPENSIKERWI